MRRIAGEFPARGQRNVRPNVGNDIGQGLGREVFFETFGDKEGCFLEAYDAMIDLLVARVSNAFVGTVECPWPDRVGTGAIASVRVRDLTIIIGIDSDGVG